LVAPRPPRAADAREELAVPEPGQRLVPVADVVEERPPMNHVRGSDEPASQQIGEAPEPPVVREEPEVEVSRRRGVNGAERDEVDRTLLQRRERALEVVGEPEIVV